MDDHEFEVAFAKVQRDDARARNVEPVSKGVRSRFWQRLMFRRQMRRNARYLASIPFQSAPLPKIYKVAHLVKHQRGLRTQRFLERLRKADRAFEENPYDLPANHWEGKSDSDAAAYFLAVMLSCRHSADVDENLFDWIEARFFQGERAGKGYPDEQEVLVLFECIEQVSVWIEAIGHPESEWIQEALEPLRDLVLAGETANFDHWKNYQDASFDLIDFAEKVCI